MVLRKTIHVIPVICVPNLFFPLHSTKQSEKSNLEVMMPLSSYHWYGYLNSEFGSNCTFSLLSSVCFISLVYSTFGFRQNIISNAMNKHFHATYSRGSMDMVFLCLPQSTFSTILFVCFSSSNPNFNGSHELIIFFYLFKSFLL